MKARIDKKLSKKLKAIAPSIFRRAWLDSSEPSFLASMQGTRVNHVWSIGGDLNYWGEETEYSTLWEAWSGGGNYSWMWTWDFPGYPHGHEHAGYPDTRGFKPTTQNLLKLAAKCEARRQGGKS